MDTTLHKSVRHIFFSFLCLAKLASEIQHRKKEVKSHFKLLNSKARVARLLRNLRIGRLSHMNG